jgi:hypothetical protein
MDVGMVLNAKSTSRTGFACVTSFRLSSDAALAHFRLRLLAVASPVVSCIIYAAVDNAWACSASLILDCAQASLQAHGSSARMAWKEGKATDVVHLSGDRPLVVDHTLKSNGIVASP